MKSFISKITMLLILLIGVNTVSAQNCKVSHKNLNETYQGDCKKGKAHGKGFAKGTDSYKGEFKKGFPDGIGIYTWANGDVYEGEFKKGKKEGKGKLAYNTTTKDSIVEGYWSKDEYIGVNKTPYKLLTKSENIVLVNFSRRPKEHGNAIRLYFKKNDRQVPNPKINRVVATKGNYTNQRQLPNYLELAEVTYPIKLIIQYELESFEFEVFQPGTWKILTELRTIDGLNAPTSGGTIDDIQKKMNEDNN